jgi:RNA polymerase sigma-70 factor (ECF subfamily)
VQEYRHNLAKQEADVCDVQRAGDVVISRAVIPPKTKACDAPGQEASFGTTHWSVVLAAGNAGSPQSAQALECLCRTYWFPLYAFARRSGHAPPDAEDLTQEFFARVLERHWLARADSSKGRFRTFLLTAMTRFLAHEQDKARALKRGGLQRNVPIQWDTAETRYGVEPADPRTPEQAFEYHWAVALLDEVLRKLEAEFAGQNQASSFAVLKSCLVGDRESQPYAELADRLGMEKGAVKVAVHRLRRRYRALLRSEIAQTVASPGEIDAEMRHLHRVLAGS